MIWGQPITGLGRRRVASLVQPIFQNPYSSLNPRKSIGYIIMLPLKVPGDFEPGAARRRVEEMMELIDLRGGFTPIMLSEG